MLSLQEVCAKVTGTATQANAKGSNKTDPSTLGIVFMACLCAVLPLDISQLTFAILGAVLYALRQKSDKLATKKQAMPTIAASFPYNAPARSAKPKQCSTGPVSVDAPHAKPSVATSIAAETRAVSVQPIIAPTFASNGWDGEIQELLLQITPTAEAEQIVNQLAQKVKQAMQSMIPEIEVNGFANGNLTFGKAFGVAVPEVDIIANVSPQVLFHRLHGRSSQCNSSQLDEKKLQKSAIRACTDRLVAAAGFKFRRSAFRGQEPKVTLLVPASLGLFPDSIPIDFSVNVVTPLYNAALLTECGRIDSCAKELILLVKRWAKDRGICHAAKGHLSPYMWGLLAIYFLQVGVREEGPLLPPLEEFQICSGLIKGKKANKASKRPKWEPSQSGIRTSAGVLFKEFVHFFNAEFDWCKEAVSIQAATRAAPSQELPLHILVADDSSVSQVGPSIEDPFHEAQNLGDSMTMASFARLKEELSRAESYCLRDASLSELLEPWAPPEAAEPEVKEADGKVEVQKAQITTVASKTETSTTPPWRRPGAVAATKQQAK